MKLDYYPDTDSLSIDLTSRSSVESQEVSEGVVLDYNAEGTLVGIDIDHASRKLDLRELVTSPIPRAATKRPNQSLRPTASRFPAQPTSNLH